MSRRAALAAFGIGTAAAGCKKGWTPPEEDAFGLARAKPYVPGSESWAAGEERWASTACAQCPAGCGVRVRVVEGRAVRIEGNPANPLNRGGVGPRGLSGLQVLYDPDRIPGPMMRKAGELSPVTWDEALEAAATALAAARAEAPERLLILSGREWGIMNELWERFAAAFGTPNLVDGRPSRTAAVAQAMDAALGTFEIPVYDWAGARTVLSLEAGLVEDSCQSVYFARVAAELRHSGRQRSQIIHAGPAFDLSAHNADDWVQLQPGTSGAFALGLCRELIRAGTYDEGFASTAQGFAAFAEAVDRYTPEQVREIAGVKPEVTERVAAELWGHRPSFAVVDPRSVAYTNGLATARASLMLNALLGAIEAPAGGVRIAPEPPLRPWPDPTLDETARRGAKTQRLDGAGGAEYPAARSVHETLPDALGQTPPQVALLYHANPIYARQQPERWRAALAGAGTVISFSPFLDETTAELAHIVLPDHTYLERYEDAASPTIARATMGVRQPVVAPLHDTRATGDVILELSRRLGGSIAASLPWRRFRDALDARLLGLHDAARGTVQADSEREFLHELYAAGVWAESALPPPRDVRFRFDGAWEAPEWRGDAAAYPLRLLIYRPLGYAEGGGVNQPWLHTLRTRPGEEPWSTYATVHPKSAPGLTTGDEAVVSSPWGQMRVRVRIESRALPGFVAVPLGGGHTAYGRFARGRGENPMTVAAPGAARGSGANVLCGTRVKLDRGGARG